MPLFIPPIPVLSDNPISYDFLASPIKCLVLTRIIHFCNPRIRFLRHFLSLYMYVCKASLNGPYKTERSLIEFLVYPPLCNSLSLWQLASCRFPATTNNVFVKGIKTVKINTLPNIWNTNNANRYAQLYFLHKEETSTLVNRFFHTISVYSLPKTHPLKDLFVNYTFYLYCFIVFQSLSVILTLYFKILVSHPKLNALIRS